MKHDESITKIFAHFMDIINNLKSLGKSYSNSNLVRKILKPLPRTWEAKVTAIQEAKDLNILFLEELLGSLMTHELSMKQHQEEDIKKKRIICWKIYPKKPIVKLLTIEQPSIVINLLINKIYLVFS